MTRYFTGFSTVNSTTVTGLQVLYDIDLINQDLMNHFQTRIGERVMRPTFGCKIWDYFMEQLNSYTLDQIVAEATRVCEADERLEVVSINVTQLDSGIRIEIVLNYVPYNVINSFQVDFEQNETASVSGPSF